jgi:hypothetical protein
MMTELYVLLHGVLLVDPAWSSLVRFSKITERDVIKRFDHVRLGNSSAGSLAALQQLYALHFMVLRASSSSNGSEGPPATGSSARCPRPSPSHPCNDPRRLTNQVGAAAASPARKKREPNNVRGSFATFSTAAARSRRHGSVARHCSRRLVPTGAAAQLTGMAAG